MFIVTYRISSKDLDDFDDLSLSERNTLLSLENIVLLSDLVPIVLLLATHASNYSNWTFPKILKGDEEVNKSSLVSSTSDENSRQVTVKIEQKNLVTAELKSSNDKTSGEKASD